MPTPTSLHLLFEHNKDVEMGLSVTFCLGVASSCSIFHEVTSPHPPSFQRNDKTLYGKAL